MDADSGRPTEPPRCARCGDVVGVYEPYVLVVGDDILYASRASRPDLPPDGLLYHGECHAGEGPRL